MDGLQKTVEMIYQIKEKSRVKPGRNFMDFFGDRIKIALSETTLLGFIERLANIVDAEMGYIKREVAGGFIKVSSGDEAPVIMAWLRKYPKVAAMIIFQKEQKERESILAGIPLEDIKAIEPGRAVKRRAFEVKITATCTTPLAHGSDVKAGNASLFRRMDALSDTSQVLTLPYYAGNALRGQIRDLLADHLLFSIGKTPNRTEPPVALWFFHCLYAGGALSEKTKDLAKILKLSGGVGNNAEGITKIRDMLPALSALGFAFGNRVLSGRFECGDLRPQCYEWGNHEHIRASELIEWVFLTRREDHEGHEDNSSMIANTECLKPGTVLDGGIDISAHASEIERAALGKGLFLLKERGRIGAESRRDLGGVLFEFENLPDPAPYDEFLKSKKQDAIDFLNEIGAFKGNLAVEGESIAVAPDNEDVPY